MKAFTQLFENVDATTSTNEKIDVLKKYFAQTNSQDAMWAVLILTSRVSKRVLTSRSVRELFLKATNYPDWLFEESYSQVGDTAETVSLLLQSQGLTKKEGDKNTNLVDKTLSEWMETEIPQIAEIEDVNQKSQKLLEYWKQLLPSEIFVLSKLMTGGFRVGVSERLVVRALADVFGVPTDLVAHRLTGQVAPGGENFERLISPGTIEFVPSQPYPFCLAHAWTDRSQKDWNPATWAIEWKYDGIRSQAIKREDQGKENLWIWSRGEEEIKRSFPDLVGLFEKLPAGSVLDGEILIIKDGRIQPFQALQKRLGRKKVSPTTLKDYPAGFMAYDCLEYQGQDIRQKSLRARKMHLNELCQPLVSDHFLVSPILKAESLEDLEALRAQSRETDAEGLMLKDWESNYSVGRKTGAWWKHKVDPLTLDAALIYAQAGTGRRANLYTDYTFALWSAENEKNERQLVPFAKAYSGLNQAEIDELDAWIRRHTKEKFGPVRSLQPHHVFEIAFEGILASKRHKSGIAVRFPRILRWRKDKKVEDADTLQTAMHLLNAAAGVIQKSEFR